MACAQKNPLSLVESRACRGREGINLLVHAYHPISLFSFVVSNFSFLFPFLFFSQCLLQCHDFFLKVTIIVIPPAVHGNSPLYNACRGWLLLFQPLITFVWFGCSYRPPLVCQSLSHNHLPVLAVPLLITRQRRLFCSFVCRGTLTCYGVGALSLSPSLIACTQQFQLILASFGRYIISIGHFPQKSLSRNPRIGFSLSLPLDHPLLLLTHDPAPLVLAGYRPVKSGPCACSTSVCVQNLPATFVVVQRLLCTFCCPSLTSYGMSYFLIPHSLWPISFRGRALLDYGLFFLQPTLLLLSVVLLSFLAVPFCHSCCDVI